MAQIRIIYSGILSANQILRKTVREITQLEETFIYLTGAVAPEIQSHYQIAERLRISQHTAEEIHQAADKIFEVTETGLLKYRITETALKQMAPADDEIFEMR